MTMRRLLNQNKLKRVNTLLRNSNRSLPVFTWLSSIVKTLQSSEDLEASTAQRHNDHLKAKRNLHNSSHIQNASFQLSDEDFLELLPANGYIH